MHEVDRVHRHLINLNCPEKIAKEFSNQIQISYCLFLKIQVLYRYVITLSDTSIILATILQLYHTLTTAVAANFYNIEFEINWIFIVRIGQFASLCKLSL